MQFQVPELPLRLFDEVAFLPGDETNSLNKKQGINFDLAGKM
jgi:hypothetical protein